jgi:ABC-2 type transport system ATP-binding protein
METETGREVHPNATREDVPRLVTDLVNNGHSIYEVRVLRTTLEESYLEAVEGDQP